MKKMIRGIITALVIPKSYQYQRCCFSSEAAKTVALRSRKAKSGDKNIARHFVDVHHVKTIGGRGGDGCISFLQLWSNDKAGPDGADGGHGGHVVFQASSNVKDLGHVPPIVKAEHGEKGYNKDCCGKNAKNTVILVPVGTVIKDANRKIVGDLDKEEMMFIAARGGAGGHGNHFFASDKLQAPQIAEFGAVGENLKYTLEVKSMAHIGLIGFPNAGKSTLLQAISRAKPKVAPYPFTTLQPHLGMVQYSDYEQIAVADLPGLIPGSYQNKGLGIQFLKHAERCSGLLYIIDASVDQPWTQLEILQFELSQFSKELLTRPYAVIANKMDLVSAQENLNSLEEKVNLPIIPISAKTGKNLTNLLAEIRKMYDSGLLDQDKEEKEEERCSFLYLYDACDERPEPESDYDPHFTN